MATLEVRGYVNRRETKSSSKGVYTKFTLGVQQKSKGRDGQMKVEKLFVNCVDFSNDCPAEGTYVGVSGYVTLGTYKPKDGGDARLNIDVVVKSYETLEQRSSSPKAPKGPSAEEQNPFGDIPF